MDLNTDLRLKKILEIFRFEHWVRFYYIKDTDGALSIEIPEKVMESLKKDHEILHDMAQIMNNRPIDMQASQENICGFIGSRVDFDCPDPEEIPKILDKKDFKLENYLFNLWVSSHEQLLDDEPLYYTQWDEKYNEWRKSDQVQSYVNDLTKSSPVQKGSRNLQ